MITTAMVVPNTEQDGAYYVKTCGTGYWKYETLFVDWHPEQDQPIDSSAPRSTESGSLIISTCQLLPRITEIGHTPTSKMIECNNWNRLRNESHVYVLNHTSPTADPHLF